VVRRGDDLGVAGGLEPRAVVADELAAQLHVVVDLAVEGEQVATVGVRQRLVAGRDVDDGQPLVGEHHVLVDDPGAGLVRTTVVQRLQGFGDRLRL